MTTLWSIVIDIDLFLNEKSLLFILGGGGGGFERGGVRERERDCGKQKTFFNIIWEKKTMLGSFSTPIKRS